MWRILCLAALCLVGAPQLVCADSTASTAAPGTVAAASQTAPVSPPSAVPAAPKGAPVTPKKESATLTPDKVIAHKTDHIRIEVHYPELGLPSIDADISEWAKQISDNFIKEFEGETAEVRSPYDLSTSYTLLRPATDTAVTVVWEVASYTQGAHGNLDIVTYSYALPGGDPLSLGELFTDLGTALNLMSESAYSRLSRTLGDMLNEDMLRSGTTPDPDNFSSFALVPGALRIFFQPYQVAPWAAGPQTVDIPLEELEDADPQYVYWGGKKEEVNPPL